MARLKKISEEERLAKNQLREMGVTDWELDRLYDANYKARKRAAETGGNPGKTLNFSWAQTLRNVKQAQAQGKTANEYIAARRESLANTYRVSKQKKGTLERLKLTPTQNAFESWGDELMAIILKRESGKRVSKLEADIIKELESEDVIPEDIKSKVYRKAKEKYITSGASTQEEWDKLLGDEYSEEEDVFDIVKESVAEAYGVNIDEINEKQDEYEALAETLFDMETESGRKAAARFLQEKKRGVFNEYLV